ncbi:MAG: ATP--dephospho-CoA triphosphoribosyl transferase CitG [Candidatus Altiarchaeales archaeon ex4484_2]|nr:MAG: ATP--dephospho-CoA triphosphoribosyl transferase CitG [Candidatus Altiarchaeales archaeon ex4484_2]
MIDGIHLERIKQVSELAVEAALLEVNSPKPGNITPQKGFEDTSYKDFLLGCEALRRAVKDAATNGFLAGEGELRYSRIGLGELIKKAVIDVRESHTGGNTHLGLIMLFIPLAAAAGVCISQHSDPSEKLGENLEKIIKLSSVEDSVRLYEAILLSGMSNLGNVRELDVQDKKSLDDLRSKNINLHRLMQLSAEKDYVARELATGLNIVFNISAPTLQRIHRQIEDTKAATIQAYLILLSRFPDSLILRKMGLGVAEHVSMKAKEVLDLGGVLTPEGRCAIDELDKLLRSEDNKLNPGTTADLIAATIYVLLLYTDEKLRPEEGGEKS